MKLCQNKHEAHYNIKKGFFYGTQQKKAQFYETTVVHQDIESQNRARDDEKTMEFEEIQRMIELIEEEAIEEDSDK